MIKEFLSSLNIKNLMESFSEKLGGWVDVVTSGLSDLLNPLYQKALANPLPAGAILLALFGIPLIFSKVKNKKTEPDTDDRLDQLMEEMRNYEINAPMIDLQKNFSDAPASELEPPHEEIPFTTDFEIDRTDQLSNPPNETETLDSENMIELPSLFLDEEHIENKTSDDPKSDDPKEETGDAPFSSSIDSIENQLQLNDSDPELEGTLDQDSDDWSRISRSALSGYDDTEFSIEAIESLQDEIEESTRESPLDVTFENEKEDFIQEIHSDTASPPPEPVEPISQNESIEEPASEIEENVYFEEKDSLLQSTAPVSEDSDEEFELSLPEEAVHQIPLQETFEENFDNQVQSTVTVPEKIVQEPQFPDSFPLKPILKSQPAANHTRIQSPGKDYKSLLESFILLKNQKK
jgi:hypothetical protein